MWSLLRCATEKLDTTSETQRDQPIAPSLFDALSASMLVLKRAAFAIAVLSLLDASEAFTERLPASLFGVPTRLRANLVASVLNIETRAVPAM